MLGYDSRNPFTNQGTLTLDLFQYVLKLAVFIIIKIMKLKKLEKKLTKQIFYSEILTITYQSYLELLIAAILNLNCAHKGDPDNNMYITVYVYVVLLMILLVFPVAILYVSL